METTVCGTSDGSPRATPAVGAADLRRAIDDDELFLLFQPLIDLHADRVAGVEALLRWRSPDGVVIGPDHFIPLAEQTGLIIPMGALVLELACRQWVAWQDEDEGCIPVVSVNVSVLQLAAPGFVRTVGDVLARTGAAASGLCLEITESALGSDGGHLVAQLHELRALGLRISVDDFGTGFSSLARLRDFPVDELKIDRSFVRDMHLHERDRAIVRSIVALGSALRLTVVAEGVETAEQLAILRTLGCDAAQGHLFSVPAPAAVVQRCVRDRWSPRRGLGRAPHEGRAPMDEATDAEVGFLLALAVSVVASADLGSALETILPDVCIRLGWDCAQAWTPEGDDLRCAPQWHGDGADLASFRAASLEMTLVGTAGLPGRARSQRRAIWSDVSTDEDFLRHREAYDAGLRTGVAVPIIADGEVAAVVEFFARQTPHESSRTIGILASVVTHLGSFLERKQAQRSLEGVRSQWDGVIQATEDAVVVSDRDGGIVEWNLAAERMFGWRRAEVLDGPLSIIVPPAQRERHEAGYARAVAGRAVSGQRLELEALHRDGSTFPIELTLSALPEGQAAAFVGLVRDLSERGAAELELARHASQLEDLIRMLQSLVEPGAACPSTMSAVVGGIAALCRADGAFIELRSGEELVHAASAGIAAPLPGTGGVDGSLSATCARTGAVQRCEDTEDDDRVDPDACRSTGIRSMVVVPLTHRDDLHGVLTVVSSATGCIAEDDLAVLVLVAGFLGATVAQAQAADDLATTVRSRELLMRAAIAVNRAATLAEAVGECLELVSRCAGAVVGHLLLAAETGPEALVSSGMLWCADGFDVSALASKTATHRFGARDGIPGRALAERRPVWVEDVSVAVGRRGETATRSGVHACMAFPVLVAERVVAVIELGLPAPRACDERLVELAGQLGELLGRAFEREEAAVALGAAEERFRMMFEHAPIAMCLTSFSGATKGQLMDANQALCDLLGLSRDELVGRTFSSITSPGSDVDAACDDVYEAVDAGATVFDLHKSYLRVDGDPVPCHVVATIVRDATGLPLYSVTQIRDIRAELAEREALSHQALHDPLTGLANRRMLDARLGPIVAGARRSGRTVSVFVVDLDGLKATNDRLGHDAGDAAIIAAGAALVRCLRPEDLVVRIGGDEFVAMVDGSAVAPWRTARRLERAVADSSPRSGDRALSASTGWAVDDGVVLPDLLITRADARMYERKRAKARAGAR